MHTSTLRKTAVAVAVAGSLAAAAPAEAVVLNFTWDGAFTFLDNSGGLVKNVASDYTAGYYANGDNNVYTFGAPFYPGNNVHGTPGASGAFYTAGGWNGNRTPISGTLSFDTITAAGVGTINPFFFFGDTPGSGPGTSVANFSGVSFQAIDTVGTLIGTMLFSWNGGGHSMSIVLDASGLFGALPAAPTTVISGVGALPATNGISPSLGPTPIASKTLNTGAGCDGLTLATQVNAYTIVTNTSNLATCMTGMVDDGIGGDPMTSVTFSGFNANIDIGNANSMTLVSIASAPVPVPAAVWLFGSGLLGLMGVARRRKKAN